MTDYEGVVGCEACRETLSARLDGEDEPGQQAVVDAHLAECADCQAWLDDAAMVTRLIRTSPAPPATVDVTDAVLPAVPGPGRAKLARVLRLALGVVGVAQLTLGLIQVAMGGTASEHAHEQTILTGATAGHLWHESAAWNVAIGVGFLWLALQRTTPGGIGAILSAFLAVLTVLNINDLIAGQVELTHVATHALVLTGYLIVLALSRRSLRMDRPPSADQRAAPWWRPRLPTSDPVAAPASGNQPRPARRLPAATAGRRGREPSDAAAGYRRAA